tara:strand:+ start:2116 stop:2403 length:288 start_codon:yes stop_codon:yes gene_type:complete
MKKLLLLIFYPFCLLAQFNDDFSTLENWTGDTNKFEIDSIEQLHLFWDGTTYRNEVTKAGLYIFWLEATHLKSPSLVEKQTTVVARLIFAHLKAY